MLWEFTLVYFFSILNDYRKLSKKKLMKELKAALEKNNFLREKVASLTAEEVEINSPCSSTMRQDFGVTSHESLLLTSMSNWTLGTINIPECVPTDGEVDIDKRAFEQWKDIFYASISLVNTQDERTLFGLFKIKAGSKLREIYNTTVSSPDMPNQLTAPLSNAMERLNGYFSSRTYILGQRGKLMNMSQAPTESSMQFVRRVGSAAKMCNYKEDEEMEAMVRVLTKGASDSRIRVLAYRNWIKQGSLKDLIDLVRDRELEKVNEDEYQRNHVNNTAVTIAAVERKPQEMPDMSYGNNRFNFRGNNRFGGQRSFRGAHNRGRAIGRPSFSGQKYGTVKNCWRCGSIFHFPQQCHAMGKVCRCCGEIGHIERVCS